MLRRAFRYHRTKLVSITTLALATIVLSVATAVAFRGGDQGPIGQGSNEPAGKPPASLGIDLVHCPNAEPEQLPPDALADAANAALDQAPLIFGYVGAYENGKAQTIKGVYGEAAYLAKSGLGRSPMIRQGLGCGKLLQDRSVTVDLVFPEVQSASLSQHTVFVARFGGDYWVWGIGH